MDGHTVQKHFVESTYENTDARAMESGTEHPTVAEGYPENTHYSRTHEALHDNTQYIFRSDKAAIEQS
jgi:hypothetical protein